LEEVVVLSVSPKLQKMEASAVLEAEEAYWEVMVGSAQFLWAALPTTLLLLLLLQWALSSVEVALPAKDALGLKVL